MAVSVVQSGMLLILASIIIPYRVKLHLSLPFLVTIMFSISKTKKNKDEKKTTFSNEIIFQ